MRSFSWFLDTLCLQVLAICLTLFHVDSLLLTKDMSCQNYPLLAEDNNCWVSIRTCANTGDSVKTERNSSHCTTTVERKWKVNFVLVLTIAVRGILTDRLLLEFEVHYRPEWNVVCSLCMWTTKFHSFNLPQMAHDSRKMWRLQVIHVSRLCPAS